MSLNLKLNHVLKPANISANVVYCAFDANRNGNVYVTW